ncbi:MAG: hypothetical protein A2268_06585 [Candidatus Raymondbacteria bacterium RifOxyA12_full_50_37]|uniref:HTH araC/xylS-type domain-containing protein n=1 Tax=Candidatus Raymondbacteria bacterium RIFOXYD12_FULL_49_13 TaxID=1817890 RepID=A0A1F7F7M4_UNCRA|nr:MAG: hypothetical protein A2268_06585 [Candidatus Raymondbacteria bacterium RifOxyA12_full_50_37]OGJ88733.1 MAG: hypothetical protein A2248_07725 [Candidatus Raymondbacteria bacterium RIFOXYA2_FULL_49_16]OGJ99129.1 MAG: hypothetical protein A2350_16995 [Candidatus Raymondbacteria bacterium RifOxyB12_full_50_8]OGK02517.1 MAG: hypothetical protein A2519_11980 [Candidatus Raymondbacteria bacterium RIFOXYD12_FULL_49_13]OGP42108.1 MAG: hypothetical protein A2324_14855 [Candidatus Raymondbacteria 
MIAVVLLIVFSYSSTFGEIYFHSDFERGETYTQNRVAANQNRIKLMPNCRVEEWPLDGGQGIIEGNYPVFLDTFSYDYRKGNMLAGVRGIQKTHDPGVDIRTGNLDEWYMLKDIPAVLGIKALDNKTPIFGRYSAMLNSSDAFYAMLSKEVLSLPNKLYFRFYVRFSNELLSSEKIGITLFAPSFNFSQMQVINLQNNNKNEIPYLSLGMLDPRYYNIIAKESRIENRVEIRPGENYSVEYELFFADSVHGMVVLSVNGKEQVREQCEYFPQPEAPGNRFYFGRWDRIKTNGVLFIDEFVFADTKIGPVPNTPVIIFADNMFTLKNENNAFAAHQLQINTTNSWLIPVYNSGEVAHRDITVPDGIAPDMSFYARIRLKHNTRQWSPWSEPARFKLPVTLAGASGMSEKDLPTVRKAYFTRINSQKPLDEVHKGKWYDFYVYLGDPKGWSNLANADIWLNGDPTNSIGNYENRGGPFKEAENYIMSFSITGKELWVRQTENSNAFTRINTLLGVYIDDNNGEYEQNSGLGWAKARIKLSDSAKIGPWIIQGFAANKQKKLSGMYVSPFQVVEKRYSEKQNLWKILSIIMVLLVFLLVILTAYLFKRRHAKSVLENKQIIAPLDLNSPYGENIKKAQKYILENYMKPISLKDVAAGIFVTPNWLSIFFSKGSGKTVTSYINEVRIKHAKKLLEETKLSISEISFKVGFNNFNHFINTFRKAENIAPGKYRKKFMD